MNLEKWKNITDRIKDGFVIENEGSEHDEESGGIDIEFVEFEGPLGLMRLELVSRPVVIDKKTIYSNRIGSETKVDYIYDQNERSYKMRALKWDESQGDWIEIDGKNFNI
jgi:hypothetical protein